MKKWLFILLTLLALLVISVYIFIPRQIKISGNTLIKCDNKNINLFLHDEQRWSLWWPGQPAVTIESDSSFQYKDCYYKLTKTLSHGGEMELTSKGIISDIGVSLFPINKDTIALAWQTSFTSSNNPVKRVTQYLHAFDIKKNIKAIMESLGAYVSQTKNIYGIEVIKEKVKIDFLVSTKKILSHYPVTSDVYDMVNNIRNYIARHDTKAIDSPMLNITVLDTLQYQVQVAIPVDKKLADEKEFDFRWMPRGGNMLVAKIIGGTKTVDESLQRFNQYVMDHELTVMAIPFQLLITDRQLQPDTSKWVTHLYYPVM